MFQRTRDKHFCRLPYESSFETLASPAHQDEFCDSRRQARTIQLGVAREEAERRSGRCNMTPYLAGRHTPASLGTATHRLSPLDAEGGDLFIKASPAERQARSAQVSLF
jgi:hypothetical protein